MTVRFSSPPEQALSQALGILTTHIRKEDRARGKACLTREDAELHEICEEEDILRVALQSLSRAVGRRTAALRKRRNAFAPFHSLPVELFVQVLLEATRDHEDPTRRVIQLCSVCTRWWHLIEDAPSLWSSIKLSSPKWKLALQRSKGAPLDISVDGNGSQKRDQDTFLQHLLPQVQRWRSLHAPDCYSRTLYLSLTDTLPLLESLSISNESQPMQADHFLGGPRLRQINLTAVDLRWLGTNFSALEDLRLEHLVPASPWWAHDFRNALTGCPKLSKIDLFAIDSRFEGDIPASYGSPPILSTDLSMPCLRTLHLEDVYNGFLSTFFSAATRTPHLSYLRVTSFEASPPLFETFLDTLLPALVTNSTQQQIRVTMTSTSVDVSAIGPKGRLWYGYLLYVGDWRSTIHRMGRVIKDNAPVAIRFGRSMAVTASDVEDDASFREAFPTLESVMVDTYQ